MPWLAGKKGKNIFFERDTERSNRVQGESHIRMNKIWAQVSWQYCIKENLRGQALGQDPCGLANNHQILAINLR